MRSWLPVESQRRGYGSSKNQDVWRYDGTADIVGLTDIFAMGSGDADTQSGGV